MTVNNYIHYTVFPADGQCESRVSQIFYISKKGSLPTAFLFSDIALFIYRLSPGPHMHHIRPRAAQLDLTIVFIQRIRILQ